MEGTSSPTSAFGCQLAPQPSSEISDYPFKTKVDVHLLYKQVMLTKQNRSVTLVYLICHLRSSYVLICHLFLKAEGCCA